MPRDELRKPLRKRSLQERLWAQAAQPVHACRRVRSLARFLAGGAWLVLHAPAAGGRARGGGRHSARRRNCRPPRRAPPRMRPSRGGDRRRRGDRPECRRDPGLRRRGAGEPARRTRRKPPSSSRRSRPLQPAPIADVTETTDAGPLPRISSRGRKPFDVYSQVTPLSVTSSKRPKIAIVLGGMGLNAEADEEGDRRASGRRHAGLRALWREPAGAGEPGARRGPRDHAAGADGARWLSRHQPRPEDAAERCHAANRTSRRCAGT